MQHRFLRRALTLLCLTALLSSSMPTLALGRAFSAKEGNAYLGYRGSSGDTALGGFRLASDAGSVAYCLQSAASLPSGDDYTRQVAPSLPLARIISAGYPARESAFGVSGDELRYATQVAIWQHLSQIRSVDVTRSPDEAFGASHERIRFAVDALLAGRTKGPRPAAVSPAQCEAVMLDNGSLVAGPYSVHVELGGPTYCVEVNESAAGCFPSDASGTARSTFAADEEFYLRLDARTSPRSLDATVSLTATDVTVTEWEAPDAFLQDVLEVEATQTAISLTAQAVCAELVVVKVAEDGAPVAGTRFRIRDAKGSHDAVHEITDGDRVSIVGLRAGAYTVEEVDVPSRYRVPSSQTVSLDRGGTTQVVVRNELVRGSLSIVKLDARTGTPLPGASFVLEESNGPVSWKVMASGDTDERGLLGFSRLAAGRYRVREVTAPEGYVPPEEDAAREFTIDEDGQVVSMEFQNEPVPAPTLPPVVIDPEDEGIIVDRPTRGGTIPMTGDSRSILYTLLFLGVLSATSAVFAARAKSKAHC